MSDEALVRRGLRNFRAAEPDPDDPLEAAFLPVLANLRKERRRSYWVGRKGDIAVMISSVRVSMQNRFEPAMFLHNVRRPTGKPIVVPLSQLWMLLESPNAVAHVMREWCELLFGTITKDACFRIQDCLFDFADDLKNAPPPQQLPLGDWMQALARDGLTSRFAIGDGPMRTICD